MRGHPYVLLKGRAAERLVANGLWATVFSLTTLASCNEFPTVPEVPLEQLCQEQWNGRVVSVTGMLRVSAPVACTRVSEGGGLCTLALGRADASTVITIELPYDYGRNSVRPFGPNPSVANVRVRTAGDTDIGDGASVRLVGTAFTLSSCTLSLDTIEAR